MTNAEMLYLDRVAAKVSALGPNATLEDAMRAVCDDDKRIVSNIVSNRIERRHIAQLMVERVYAQARK